MIGGMDQKRASPSFAVIAGIVLVAMGVVAGFSAPFVRDGREFAFMFGRAVAFAALAWIAVRLIGYFANPNRIKPRAPPDEPGS
jgi:hypothetical protein